jgi:tripartite-type tricarboxylate transporter receptor subunit TctC
MQRVMRAPTLAAVFVTALGSIGTVTAQTYPSRPVTIVVPAPPGGQVDTVARVVIDRMSVALGQPLIIDNVSGASTTIGTGKAARAAPDGYTLSMGNWTSHVGAPAIYPVQFDALNDFEPVALLAVAPTLIVAKKTLPPNNLRELVAWLKANPDAGTAATVGAGSPGHVSGIDFQNRTGTRLRFVPYRGGAPANQDLLAGHIDLRIAAEASQVLQHARSGSIKAFAVMDKVRWSALPDVPTTDEAGIPGLYISQWTGLWVPKGTSMQIVDKIAAAVAQTLADAGVRRRFNDIGFEMPVRDQQTPQALAAFHRAEIAKWWPIIKAANIKAE